MTKPDEFKMVLSEERSSRKVLQLMASPAVAYEIYAAPGMAFVSSHQQSATTEQAPEPEEESE